jgi:hypothetical protein
MTDERDTTPGTSGFDDLDSRGDARDRSSNALWAQRSIYRSFDAADGAPEIDIDLVTSYDTESR